MRHSWERNPFELALDLWIFNKWREDSKDNENVRRRNDEDSIPAMEDMNQQEEPVTLDTVNVEEEFELLDEDRDLYQVHRALSLAAFVIAIILLVVCVWFEGSLVTPIILLVMSFFTSIFAWAQYRVRVKMAALAQEDFTVYFKKYKAYKDRENILRDSKGYLLWYMLMALMVLVAFIETIQTIQI